MRYKAFSLYALFKLALLLAIAGCGNSSAAGEVRTQLEWTPLRHIGTAAPCPLPISEATGCIMERPRAPISTASR